MTGDLSKRWLHETGFAVSRTAIICEIRITEFKKQTKDVWKSEVGKRKKHVLVEKVD